MKKIATFFFCFLLSKMLVSQQSDKAIGAVHYSYFHILDSTNHTDTYTTDMILFFGKNASVFESPTKREWDSLFNIQKTKSGNILNPNLKAIPARTITSLMYNFLKESKFIIIENEFNDYLMEDNYPPIPWRIISDSNKMFGDIQCIKAIGSFRGRVYEVWFAPSIPLAFGPWKLNGLPGLILEAYDVKKEVYFKFISLENYNTSLNVIVDLPKEYIKTTKKEFEKLKETIARDPFSYMKNTMGITLNAPPNFKPRPTKSKNPLELTE